MPKKQRERRISLMPSVQLIRFIAWRHVRRRLLRSFSLLIFLTICASLFSQKKATPWRNTPRTLTDIFYFIRSQPKSLDSYKSPMVVYNSTQKEQLEKSVKKIFAPVKLTFHHRSMRRRLTRIAAVVSLFPKTRISNPFLETNKHFVFGDSLLEFQTFLFGSWHFIHTMPSFMAINDVISRVDVIVYCDAATCNRLPPQCFSMPNPEVLKSPMFSTCYYRIINTHQIHAHVSLNSFLFLSDPKLTQILNSYDYVVKAEPKMIFTPSFFMWKPGDDPVLPARRSMALSQSSWDMLMDAADSIGLKGTRSAPYVVDPVWVSSPEAFLNISRMTVYTLMKIFVDPKNEKTGLVQKTLHLHQAAAYSVSVVLNFWSLHNPYTDDLVVRFGGNQGKYLSESKIILALTMTSSDSLMRDVLEEFKNVKDMNSIRRRYMEDFEMKDLQVRRTKELNVSQFFKIILVSSIEQMLYNNPCSVQNSANN